RHTRSKRDWSSDVCSSDLGRYRHRPVHPPGPGRRRGRPGERRGFGIRGARRRGLGPRRRRRHPRLAPVVARRDRPRELLRAAGAARLPRALPGGLLFQGARRRGRVADPGRSHGAGRPAGRDPGGRGTGGTRGPVVARGGADRGGGREPDHGGPTDVGRSRRLLRAADGDRRGHGGALMATVTERLTDLGYAAGWAAVRALPEPVARTLFRAGADVAARRQDENSQLRRNLSRVLGVAPADVPDDLVRDALRSYARYWREAFRLPSTDHEAVAREMDRTIDGVEHLDAALEKGRGAVVALPHSANWDRGGTWLARRYGTFATVAERLKPESLYQRFLAYREGLGFTIIPHSGGGTPPLARLEEFLAGGGVVCLLGERDLRRTGVPVTFFGEPTRMPAGPARLAVQTGAPLLVAEFRYQDKESMRVRIHRSTSPVVSRPRRRRWPTRSPPGSRATPRTGTCSSPCGSTTSPPTVVRISGAEPGMRIGMICPYSFDAPGGVQAHVVDLSEELRRRGHTVRILAPGRPENAPVSGMTLVGPGVAIPYNGSVARLSFGPATWRATRRWLREEPLDVLHIHEPNAPGVGMFALAMCSGPIAATFHTSTSASLVLGTFDGVLAPFLEKIRGRIAVSTLARRWQMEALGSDAVEIPNGVDVSAFSGADGAGERSTAPTVAFL